ncbi:MAG: SDR family NAD(P)-dependent oxidoreductase, partial [Thermodesulfobacteriota bacterium]
HILNMSSVVGRKAFPHFGAYSSIMHAITGFTASLRQELRGSGVNVSIIHPALTQTPLLEHVKQEDMPPPFRRFTPIPVERVGKAVLDGIHNNMPRIIVPFLPKLMLLADAISPTIGDLIVRLLPNKVFAFLFRSYNGKIYQHA